MCKVYALLSAFFAALTVIFAKIGVNRFRSRHGHPNRYSYTARTGLTACHSRWAADYGGKYSDDMEVSINTTNWAIMLLRGECRGLRRRCAMIWQTTEAHIAASGSRS